jgi:hypothetical protein
MEGKRKVNGFRRELRKDPPFNILCGSCVKKMAFALATDVFWS